MDANNFQQLSISALIDTSLNAREEDKELAWHRKTLAVYSTANAAHAVLTGAFWP
jgi:hypothetical protein